MLLPPSTGIPQSLELIDLLSFARPLGCPVVTEYHLQTAHVKQNIHSQAQVSILHPSTLLCENFDLICRKVSPPPTCNHRQLMSRTASSILPLPRRVSLSLTSTMAHKCLFWHFGLLLTFWLAFVSQFDVANAISQTYCSKENTASDNGRSCFSQQSTLPYRANARNRIVPLPIQWQLQKPMFRIRFRRSARLNLLVFKYNAG